MGYEDYVIGDSVISRVYYVEGLGHNLFSVGQFCDSDLEVAFRKHSCFIRDINGADLLKGPEPIIMTPGQLKSGLAPTDKELEMLFQPMFDEYLEQSRVNEPIPSATEVNAQVVPPGTSLSTTIAQDAPSTKCRYLTKIDMHIQSRTSEPGSAQSSSGNVNSTEPNPSYSNTRSSQKMDQRSPS
ncbi:hypothetical protein Tco_1164497 [Tanacetum coccineum]